MNTYGTLTRTIYVLIATYTKRVNDYQITGQS